MAIPLNAPRLCPRDGGSTLKALVTGACALVLCVIPAAAGASSPAELEAALSHHAETIRKDESVVRFFRTHAWLLADARFSDEAHLRLTQAKRRLAHTRVAVAHTRTRLADHKRRLAARAREREQAQEQLERARQLDALNASPQKAICHVFGDYCGQALQVARCESGLQLTAQNGQYLGLFQMGSSERRLFGHGVTALEQSRAAHRYFVRSGRDWSPWSCKPWR